ncbi:MAG TPA: hypothetical protein VFY75_01680 [Solirubrobacterales bacterium]|nr:hypothetical protein [Solirubrobacterales bacterium]
MKYVKMLGLLAVAAASLMAFAGNASASQLTSPSGTIYSGEFKATGGTIELHGEAFSVNCKTSSMAGNVTEQGSGITIKIPFSFQLGSCSFPVTITVSGTLIFHVRIIPPRIKVTVTGLKFTIHGPFGINCLYEANETELGTLTEGTTAKLDIESALIPRTGDSAFCGSFGELTGSLTVNTPDTLLADE